MTGTPARVGPGGRLVSVVLPAGMTAPRSSRQFVVGHCAELDDDLVQDAVLLSSELVTNAVLHGAPSVTLQPWIHLPTVEITVTDMGPMRVPTTLEDWPGVDVSAGRGLRIVDQLSTAWGVESDADAVGKSVWFTLDRRATSRAGERRSGEGEGRQGLDQRLTVLFDLRLAHQDVLALLADTGFRLQRAFASWSQVGDGQLERGGHVLVVDGAADGRAHGGVDKSGEHAAVDGARGVEVTVVRDEFGCRLPASGRLRRDPDRVGETAHLTGLPGHGPGATQRTFSSRPAAGRRAQQ